MKVFFFTLCLIMLCFQYSHADIEKTSIILPFSRAKITSVKTLPKKNIAMLPKNKRQYIHFIPVSYGKNMNEIH